MSLPLSNARARVPPTTLWVAVTAAAVALWLARVTEGRVMASDALDISTRVVISKVVRV